MVISTHQILLIEDNDDHACIIQELLHKTEDFRCDVMVAGRLSQAVNLLETDSPDLILLDLTLPDSSGLETLERIKEQAQEIPVVVLTASDDRSLGNRSVQTDAQDYILKELLELVSPARRD